MKKIFLMAAVVCMTFTAISCNSNKNKENNETPQIEQSEEIVEFTEETDDQVSAFIRDLYLNNRYSDDAFLEAHCTEDLLTYLNECYDYDFDPGTRPYAGWMFRSESQDVCGSELLRLWKEGDWYYYEGDEGGGFKFINRIKASIVDGQVIMEELERVKGYEDYQQEANQN